MKSLFELLHPNELYVQLIFLCIETTIKKNIWFNMFFLIHLVLLDKIVKQNVMITSIPIFKLDVPFTENFILTNSTKNSSIDYSFR